MEKMKTKETATAEAIRTEYIFLKGLEITDCRIVPLQNHCAANL